MFPICRSLRVMSWRHRGPMESATSWTLSQPCGMQMLTSECVTDKCHWIASVCCCTAENCWAKPSKVSPNSPPWEMGRRESVPCRRPSSLPGWARDGAPGPPWWTSPSRGTAPWLSSLVERSQSPCAAPASTPGRYYPRAPVWVPWLGEPAG